MATRNLEKDKARFAEWRRQKQGREPIPEELWQIAAGHIGGLSVNRVSREFRLSFSRLREKAQEFGLELPKAGRSGPLGLSNEWHTVHRPPTVRVSVFGGL